MVAGERDIVFPLEQVTDMARRIRRARLHVLPGCSHVIFGPSGQEFQRIVKEFLAPIAV